MVPQSEVIGSAGNSEFRNQSAMTPLERITARVNRAGDVNKRDTPRPLLSLEEFFDGNDEVGSIGANLSPTPTPTDLHAALCRIRDRLDVADVLVEVLEQDGPESWPFSETVWVITRAEPDDVVGRLPESLRPDETYVGWTDWNTRENYDLPAGFRPIGLWWD